jgi:effector-binding domain-containing protein
VEEVVDMTHCAVREFGPETCATLLMRGPYDQMPQAFARVYGWLEATGHTPQGMPVAVYLNDPATVAPADAQWEVWAPIEEGAPDVGRDDEGLAVTHIPAMTIATTIHKGPYDQVGPAYERLTTWITEQGLQPCGPPMEAYLNDPGEATADEYLTKIMIPVGPPTG